MKIVVFYSWQSDLPNPTNRGFIERALKKAIAGIRSTSVIELDIVLDRDTQQTTGSPDIAHTIFDKILNASVFVGDVSIINSNFKELSTSDSEVVFRPCPNPNVMIELGFAARHLQWSNIVCVFNTAFGKINDLPFDLRQRRLISYCASPLEDKLTSERGRLTKALQNALQAIINLYETRGKESVITPLNALVDELEHNILVASSSGSREQGGRFRDVQYNRIIEQGVFSILDDTLKNLVREAYVATSLANGYIESFLHQQPRGNAWAEASNQAGRAISAAKPKIETARDELKLFVQSVAL